MNENSAEQNQSSQEQDVHLIDLLIGLLKHKKLIIYFIIFGVVVTVALCLLLPKKYKASATVLPPKDQSSSMSGVLLQAAGALGGLAADMMGGKSSSDVYMGILESRAVADMIIEQFQLKTYYEKDTLVDTYEKLTDVTKIEKLKNGEIVGVTVEDKSPQKAAQMANAYIEALDQINKRVNTSEGQRKRVFVEGRLALVKDDLAKAEVNLKEFQEKYKLVALDEQAKAAIYAAATIKGTIITSETELEVLKQFGTERQNEAVMLKSRIAELRKQLERMESGNQGKASSDTKQGKELGEGYTIPFDEMPALALQFARLLREAKVQEEVFKLLTSQYEMAKIEEAKDVNTIQILDRALPPDKKSSPKALLLSLIFGFLSVFISVSLAFLLEYIARLKTDKAERYRQIVQLLKFRKPKVKPDPSVAT